MKYYWTPILLILCTASLSAQTGNLNFSKMTYGQQAVFFNARSMALGGSGIAGAKAVHGAALNPALLTRSEKDVQFSVSGLMHKLEEDRSFPYYDNFGGFVDYGSFAFNDNWYGDFQFSAIARIPNETIGNLVVGLSLNNISDFNYEYVEEVRTTGFSDAILAYNRIESDGVFRNFLLSVALQPVENISVGISLGLISGEVDQAAAIDSVDDSMQNIRMLERNNLTIDNTAIQASFGATMQVNPFLKLGATVTLPVTLSLKNSYRWDTQNTTLPRIIGFNNPIQLSFSEGTSGFDSVATAKFTREIKWPLQLGFGGEYRFTNVLQALISFDFRYTFWSDFEDDLVDKTGFEDSWRVSSGIEHIFFDNMPFRVGFSHGTLREGREFTRTVFTVGTGMQFDKFTIDISGAYSELTYNQRDMFDNSIYPPLVTRTDILDRVKSNDVYVMLEARYYLDWIE